jgi:hypothetical protein
LADLIDASPISRVSKQFHFVHSIITAAQQVSSREVKDISEQIFGLFAKFAISNSPKVAARIRPLNRSMSASPNPHRDSSRRMRRIDQCFGPSGSARHNASVWSFENGWNDFIRRKVLDTPTF